MIARLYEVIGLARVRDKISAVVAKFKDREVEDTVPVPMKPQFAARVKVLCVGPVAIESVVLEKARKLEVRLKDEYAVPFRSCSSRSDLPDGVRG